MSFNAKEATGGGKPRVEQEGLAGNFGARLVQLIDLGLQAQSYNGETKPPVQEIRTTYELPDEFCVDEEGNVDEDKPRWFGEEFGLFNLKSERAKSTLRYNGLDPSGAADGDWEKLIGTACTITLVQNPGKGKNAGRVFTNIGGVTPAMKGLQISELKNDALVWSLDDPDMEAFEKFPQFIQDKIKSNLEYQGSLLQQRLEGTEAPAAADNVKQEGADATVENPFE